MTVRMLTSLDDDKLHLKQVIIVHVRKENENDYVLSWREGHVHASGETVSEAMDILRESIGVIFLHFREMSETRLGRIPREQLEAMNKHIRIVDGV